MVSNVAPTLIASFGRCWAKPFRFDGRIHRVIVDVSGEHVEDYEAQMRIALAKQ